MEQEHQASVRFVNYFTHCLHKLHTSLRDVVMQLNNKEEHVVFYYYPKISDCDLDGDDEHAFFWKAILDHDGYFGSLYDQSYLRLVFKDDAVVCLTQLVQEWTESFYASLLHGRQYADLRTNMHNKGMEKLMFLHYGMKVQNIDDGYIRVQWS